MAATPAAVFPTKGGDCWPNQISRYTKELFKSQMNQLDGVLMDDFESLLAGNAVYLENFICERDNFSLMRTMLQELQEHAKATLGAEGAGLVRWSKHFKHESPTFSPTFKAIVDRLAEYFDVEVFASRLNVYLDGQGWKPFHHDSHAYLDTDSVAAERHAKWMIPDDDDPHGRVREDFTIGASLGDLRHLAFRHVGKPMSHRDRGGDAGGAEAEAERRKPLRDAAQFAFPQYNGDVFAFTSVANEKFQHGVPKSAAGAGPRFSIIAWGRRRTLNVRNSTPNERQAAGNRRVEAQPQPRPQRRRKSSLDQQELAAARSSSNSAPNYVEDVAANVAAAAAASAAMDQHPPPAAAVDMTMDELTEIVERFLTLKDREQELERRQRERFEERHGAGNPSGRRGRGGRGGRVQHGWQQPQQQKSRSRERPADSPALPAIAAAWAGNPELGPADSDNQRVGRGAFGGRGGFGGGRGGAQAGNAAGADSVLQQPAPSFGGRGARGGRGSFGGRGRRP